MTDNFVKVLHPDYMLVFLITNIVKHEIIYLTRSTQVVRRIWISSILVKTVMNTFKMVSDVHRLIMFAVTIFWRPIIEIEHRVFKSGDVFSWLS